MYFYLLFVIVILAVPIKLVPHRFTLSSRDLLTSVNSILTALKLPNVEKTKIQKSIDRHNIQFKVIEIEKFYDFTKIPKISIKYDRHFM